MTVPRRTRGAGAVVLATVALVLATFAGAAAATTAHPPGNNGTVDIHAVETAPSDRANQPHPGCTFLVAGFGFDANQHLSFTITGHGGPNAGSGSLSGSVTANGSGAFQAGPLTLPTGMYKLDVSTGVTGGHKFKVFRIDCSPLIRSSGAHATANGNVTASEASRGHSQVSPATSPVPSPPKPISAKPRFTG